MPLNRESCDWDRFFKKYELRDVLDTPGFLHAMFLRISRKACDETFWKGVQADFDGQHTKYMMIEGGLVLLRVDENFETDRASTLAGLDGQRYGGARTEFVDAYEVLSATALEGA